MVLYDHLIIGSGPAGVAAARRMNRHGTCILDVGELSKSDFAYPSLRAALERADMRELVGDNWEMCGNLVRTQSFHPKLRAPALRHVMNGEPFKVLDDMDQVLLQGSGSYARGGMSNIWGAQLLRYTDVDLAEAGDWPLDTSVFDPYYNDLEAHIGISGQVDDMFEYLGGVVPEMPAIPMVPAAKNLYSKYRSSKFNPSSKGLLLGHPRLAVWTNPRKGLEKHGFGETEFFTANQSGIYSARYTLETLMNEGRVAYQGRQKLLSWQEEADYVEVNVENIDTGQQRTFRARHLLLACGTVQTARLVLLHENERNRALPFIDHPPFLLPVFLPRMIGSKLPERSFPVQLIGTVLNAERQNMISFYYPGGLLLSDLLCDVPLPMNATVRIISSLVGGMLVAQIWETSKPTLANRLSLDENGKVIIKYPERKSCAALQGLILGLRKLGAYSHSRLASYAPPGWGFHHAGCLPMRKYPRPYETHLDGRLWSSKRVWVIDGSVLPSLPAKNHTLTLMANAARIADGVLQCGY